MKKIIYLLPFLIGNCGYFSFDYYGKKQSEPAKIEFNRLVEQKSSSDSLYIKGDTLETKLENSYKF